MDEEPKFSILYNYLIPICTTWRRLGVNLGLEEYELSLIDCDGNKMEDKLLAVLSQWRRKNTEDEPYTWRTIIDVLKRPSLKELSLARKIIKDAVEK